MLLLNDMQLSDWAKILSPDLANLVNLSQVSTRKCLLTVVVELTIYDYVVFVFQYCPAGVLVE